MSIMLAALLALAAPAAVQAGTLEIAAAAENGPDVVLDRADLESLEQVRIETNTPWTERRRAFEGPALVDVLDAAGIAGEAVELVALNDYRVTMPLDHAGPDYPIIAHRIDGKTFSVRERGPFWVIFPYDRGREFRSEKFAGWSVWQLSEIRVIP